MATALSRLMGLPAAPIALPPSPVVRLSRLEAALGSSAPRLFMKRDDLLPVALGGNKVRKLQLIAAAAAGAGADALVTCGTVSSNHARVTAAFGAMLGWRVVLVLNGAPSAEPRGNLRFDGLFGAEIRFVESPERRDSGMDEAARNLTTQGRRPFVIALGGSTPLGAMAMARAITEVSAQGIRPDLIVHASSSGGTQAGLIAGVGLVGGRSAVLGVSPDVSAEVLRAQVRRLLDGVAATLGAKPETVGADRTIQVDDTQVGDGYGRETASSREAIELIARTEGILLSPTYGAKAMASLIDRVRQREYSADQTILFWNTGGPNEY
jgi:1-aminocyclopropane-1-carboxylate deaminase/D-cysteine desulfhydrase-like pyridoxal-dependent ACC family enzyme